jgi:hypothetical protein
MGDRVCVMPGYCLKKEQFKQLMILEAVQPLPEKSLPQTPSVTCVKLRPATISTIFFLPDFSPHISPYEK